MVLEQNSSGLRELESAMLMVWMWECSLAMSCCFVVGSTAVKTIYLRELTWHTFEGLLSSEEILRFTL